MKRLADVVVALAALALLWPVMVVAAVAILLDSGPPVLFRQERVGRGGRLFRMLKFRSMGVEAPASGPHFTSEGDKRVTRVGRLLRRSSIDELPQLLNVLAGDMSIVGPRPDLPAQAGDYAPDEWELRCSVRPGITGLAQATLRSQATPQERLALDLQYVREHGIAMDLRILARTVLRPRKGTA